MTNKTYLKYVACLKRGHVWTENEIIYFRKAISGSSSLDIDLREGLVRRLEGKSYRITKGQTQKGINWLKNQCFKKNGQLRKNCPFKPFEIDVIAKFKEFRFVGVYNVSQNQYAQYMAVYRVIAKNGHYFDYVAYSMGEKCPVITVGTKQHETWCNQPDFDSFREFRDEPSLYLIKEA